MLRKRRVPECPAKPLYRAGVLAAQHSRSDGAVSVCSSVRQVDLSSGFDQSLDVGLKLWVWMGLRT